MPPRDCMGSAMKERTFQEHVASALTAEWARAIPVVALQVLWAQGRAKAVYALADALPPFDRASALAWYASLDPQPRSARAVRAATEALRGAVEPTDLVYVIAMVPLKDPEVLQIAKKVA